MVSVMGVLGSLSVVQSVSLSVRYDGVQMREVGVARESRGRLRHILEAAVSHRPGRRPPGGDQRDERVQSACGRKLRRCARSLGRAVKYDVAATADEVRARGAPATSARAAGSVLAVARTHWGLAAALAFALFVHLPALRYFFNGDDFVVLGNIEWSGTREYLTDTLKLQDYVPSWRPLPAAVYAAEWRVFGLDATGWRAVALALHLGSMALLYALLMRTAGKPAVAAAAALIFGVSGAHYETVTYITAFPHVLETFFVLASLLAIVVYTQDGESAPALFAGSFVSFALAFFTNESAFSYAPVLAGAYALFSHRWSPLRPWRLLAHAAPFIGLAAAWLAYYARSDNDQIRFADGAWGTHVFSGYALYLSWLLYPVRTIPLDPDAVRWTIGAVVAVALAWSVVRGPNLARVAAVGVLASLAPFVPVVWTTSRYSYGAMAFFAPLAALAGYGLYERARSLHRYARAPANVVALALIATVASLYAWQSYAHNARSGRDSERWRLLVDELRANYPALPPGTTIWIVDGPWTEPLSQYKEVPNVPRAVYGDGAAFDLPRERYRQDPPHQAPQVFLEWDGAHLRPVAEEEVVGRQGE